MNRRTRLLVPVLLLAVSALLLWIASRLTWLDVATFNDQSGEAGRSLVGGDWQPALIPISLGALAAIAAVALVRGIAARLVGAVIALLGVAAGGLMLSGLGQPDEDRAHAAVTSGQEAGRTNAGPTSTDIERVPEWAQVTGITTHAAGPVVTGAGAITLLAAGVVVMTRPATRVGTDDRYVTPGARRDARAEAARQASDDGPEAGDHTVGGTPAAEDPGRDLWQELDEGRDPTG